MIFFFFFFQAEDGIRDGTVTGVQTCALPILPRVLLLRVLEGRPAGYRVVADRQRPWERERPCPAGLGAEQGRACGPGFAMALILALIDGGSVLVVAGGALLIWAHPQFTGRIDGITVLSQAAGFSLCFLLAFGFADLYNFRVIRSFDALLGRVPRALCAAIPVVILFSMLVPSVRFAGDVLGSSALVVIGVVFGPFLPIRAIAYWLLRSRRFAERLLIVGGSPLARKLVGEIEMRPDCRYVVAAVVDDENENVGRVIEAIRPDRIVVALTGWRGRLPRCRLVESLAESLARGILVEDVVDTYERLTGQLALEALSPSGVIFCRDFRTTRLQSAVARAFSFLVSAIALLMLAPVIGLIALLIKLDSRGPVF